MHIHVGNHDVFHTQDDYSAVEEKCHMLRVCLNHVSVVVIGSVNSKSYIYSSTLRVLVLLVRCN